MFVLPELLRVSVKWEDKIMTVYPKVSGLSR